jgi:hypothetical protein
MVSVRSHVAPNLIAPDSVICKLDIGGFQLGRRSPTVETLAANGSGQISQLIETGANAPIFCVVMEEAKMNEVNVAFVALQIVAVVEQLQDENALRRRVQKLVVRK